MNLRPVQADDAEAIAAVYGHHVLHGLGTFEEVPPVPAEMADRIARVLATGLPYIVAEADGRLLGYAYATPYRDRSGYRFTAENSVYVAPDALGRGVGRALLSSVIDGCRAQGRRQLIAAIGDSGNAASIGLHRALGFQPAGVLRDVGFKHGRWVDVVWMQLTLVGERPR